MAGFGWKQTGGCWSEEAESCHQDLATGPELI
jgi:hypothetical protein